MDFHQRHYPQKSGVGAGGGSGQGASAGTSGGGGGGGWGATMRAAGGLTLRRGDSSANSGSAKLLSVAVVGLSGGEKEKGSIGVGKSCLCNRFVQPLADDYSVDHISVFSQSDFSGRVVNNDHFLYWGDVVKTNEEGVEFHIQVVEHTEFIDDASFQPFRGSGKSEPYVKRCAYTKLVSAEKLMYICKDQLGIEREYEQKLMPDGRFVVDGFLCVFDVSAVPNRNPEKQTELVAQIILNLVKTKKPVILAATKCDDASEVGIREIERLLNRKELKQLSIPVIETSAHEGVNVDAAFFTLAQIIDRTRGRSRILNYYEAAHVRRELLDMSTEAYLRLIRIHVTDYGVLWSTAFKKLCVFPEYQHYSDLFGRDSAQRLFRRHVKKLKDEYLGAKVSRYLDLIPQILRQMFPDFDTLGEGCVHFCHYDPTRCIGCRSIQCRSLAPWDWHLVQTRIRDHPDFGLYFVEYPEDTTWMEADLFDGDSGVDSRIPYDVLRLPEAETVYKNHLNQLHAHQQRLELRKDFKQLLEELGCVTPGKSISELKVLFLGRECYENLPEKDVMEIYELHQREIIQKAKKNFQELLLERSDLFYQFRSSPAGTVTQDDIFDITEKLIEDSRYKAMDRLDADRKLMLFQHLGFVHCPIREHCPAYPQCADSVVERIVAKKATRPPSWSRTCDNNHLNIVVLGVSDLAKDLENHIKVQCRDDEFEHEGQVFSLDYRTVSGDVSLPENAFRTQDFLPHGCFCTYSNASSFEYIRDSLEKTLLSNLEQEDRLPFQGLPLVIVFAADKDIDEKQHNHLREEGQNLSDSLQCPFIDVSLLHQPDDNAPGRFNGSLVEDALRALIESIRHRSGLLNIYKSTPNNAEPDIRIIMCMLCGDPYSVENVLGPLLTHQNSYLSGERSIAFDTQLGDSKRKVEVILSSYHSATDFRDELIHGFILVYSTKRRASLSTLGVFSMNIPELPIQIVAVTDNISHGVYTNSTDLNSILLAEGSNLADKLNAHFMTSMAAIPQKSSFYTPFFKEVFDKKSEIEHAFEDAARLDDSGEGTLERPKRQPLPPPRLDSYRLMRGIGGPPSTASRSGSGSEIYERLPDSGSVGDDLDDASFEDRLHMSGSDESEDAYIDSMDTKRRNFQQHQSGASEHLVKPSQIKNKKKQQDVESLPIPPRPSFFKALSHQNNSNQTSQANENVPNSSSPPAYLRITTNNRDSPKYTGTRPPPPYPTRSSSTALQQRPLPHPTRKESGTTRSSSMNERGSHTTFYQNRGLEPDYPLPPAPSTPPEPAPPDPSLMTSARDPRRLYGHQGADGVRRLVKASTMPAGGSHTSLEDITCWVDDSIFIRRPDPDDEVWNNGSAVNPGAFTTGRRRPPPGPPPVKPRSQVPGKLNMSDFHKVTAALNTMQFEPGANSPGIGGIPKRSPHAPLASAEDIDQHGYAVPRDSIVQSGSNGAGRVNISGNKPKLTKPEARPLPSTNEYAQPLDPPSKKSSHRERRQQLAQQHDDTDSDTDSSSDDEVTHNGSSSSGRKAGGSGSNSAQKRHRKKRGVAIPVATPKVPILPPTMPQQRQPLPTPEVEKVVQTACSDTEEEDLTDHDSSAEDRLRYKPLRGGPHLRGGGPPGAMSRGARGHRPLGPRGPRSHRGNVRSFSETSRKIEGAGHQQPAGHTVSAPFPSSYLSPENDVFSANLKYDDSQSSRTSEVLASPQIDTFNTSGLSSRDAEKARRKHDKELKAKQKDAERRKIKDEKKRAKEAEKAEKEKAQADRKRDKSKLKANSIQIQATLDDFRASADDPIPVFLKRAISFIEKEGLDAEGLYRVPGNRAHVELLFQKFDDDHNVDIHELDIAVNAVATAVKDFFFKRLPPILGPDHMSELESISMINDRSIKMLELGKLLKRLPRTNFAVIKYIFQHFVRVTEMSKDNCMDSKNLAICWWPTLLQYEFGDLGKFEAMRPHLEDIVQMMIDQFRFLFCGQEEVMMV